MEKELEKVATWSGKGSHLAAFFCIGLRLLPERTLNVTTIDIVILVIVGASAVVGFAKGAIRQLAAVAGLIAGLIAARTLYASLAEKLCPTLTDSLTVAQTLSFVLIWIVVSLVFMLVARLLTRLADIVCLGWLNRLLGGALGAAQSLLVIALLVGVLEYIDGSNRVIGREQKQASLLYYPMNALAGTFLPMAKDITQQYLLEDEDTARRTQ